MTSTPNRKPLSLSRCEDVLAYVPHALGFHPQESAVLLLIEDDHLEATLRVDLPKEADGQDQETWIQQVLRLLARLSHIQELLLIIYAPEVFEKTQRIPYSRLVEALERALNEKSFTLRQSWCRQRNHVWDYQAPGLEQAASLQSLSTNSTNLSMVLAGSAPLEVPWDGSDAPVWTQASQILNRMEGQRNNIMAYLNAWNQTLLLDTAEAVAWIHEDQDQAALLLQSLEMKFVRDLLPYLAGAGVEESIEVLIDILRGGSRDAAGPLSDYLLGRGWHAPDWQRIDRLWSLARELLGVARDDNRHALLCILAWIEWARGRGTMALCLLERAVEENPNYELAKLLQRLMSHGIMPEWATDQLRAWRANFA